MTASKKQSALDIVQLHFGAEIHPGVDDDFVKNLGMPAYMVSGVAADVRKSFKLSKGDDFANFGEILKAIGSHQ